MNQRGFCGKGKAMGASVNGFWRGITDEQLESQTGFDNDCKAWGNWMATGLQHRDVINTLHKLKLEALLSHTTDGMEEEDVDWVSPDQLMNAAKTLRSMVLAGDARVANVLKSYGLSANGINPVHEELAQDLADVVLIARYAKEQGVDEMTLEVNW